MPRTSPLPFPVFLPFAFLLSCCTSSLHPGHLAPSPRSLSLPISLPGQASEIVDLVVSAALTNAFNPPSSLQRVVSFPVCPRYIFSPVTFLLTFSCYEATKPEVKPSVSVSACECLHPFLFGFVYSPRAHLEGHHREELTQASVAALRFPARPAFFGPLHQKRKYALLITHTHTHTRVKVPPPTSFASLSVSRVFTHVLRTTPRQ